MTKLKGKALAERLVWLRAKLVDQHELLEHYGTLEDRPGLQAVIDSETAIGVRFYNELEELSG